MSWKPRLDPGATSRAFPTCQHPAPGSCALPSHAPTGSHSPGRAQLWALLGPAQAAPRGAPGSGGTLQPPIAAEGGQVPSAEDEPRETPEHPQGDSWGPCRAGRAHPQPHSPLPGDEGVTQGWARSPRTQPWAGQGLVPPAGLVSPTAQQPLGEAEPSQNAAGALPKGLHTLQIRGRVNPTSQERRASCSHPPAPRRASLPQLQHL